MVGMVAGDLTSAADGIEGYVSVAVELLKLIDSASVSFSLGGDVIGEDGQLGAEGRVNAALEDFLFKFGCIHNAIPFLKIFILLYYTVKTPCSKEAKRK